jgi:hypothetical protein
MSGTFESEEAPWSDSTGLVVFSGRCCNWLDRGLKETM